MGFWDKHLGGAPAQRGGPVLPPAGFPPQQQQQQQQQPQAYVPSPTDEPESMEEALRRDPVGIPQKAIANRTQTGRCPACDSPNWFTGAATGTPVKAHCYDCGYPMVQTGSGMGSLGGATAKGPARPAPQTYTAPPEPAVVPGGAF